MTHVFLVLQQSLGVRDGLGHEPRDVKLHPLDLWVDRLGGMCVRDRRKAGQAQSGAEEKAPNMMAPRPADQLEGAQRYQGYRVTKCVHFVLLPYFEFLT